MIGNKGKQARGGEHWVSDVREGKCQLGSEEKGIKGGTTSTLFVRKQFFFLSLTFCYR